MTEIILKGIGESLIMVLFAALFSTVFGFFLATGLYLTRPEGLRPNAPFYRPTEFLVNTLRSYPFIILMIFLAPFTKLLVGTKIGTKAAIVPLTIAAIPFAARLIESAFLAVEPGIIRAALSMGASTRQVIWNFVLPEAMPAIVLGITNTVIAIIGYSAMAGSIGGGGLGAIAINYGYNMFRTDMMVVTVIVLFVMVQAIQTLGQWIYQKIKH